MSFSENSQFVTFSPNMASQSMNNVVQSLILQIRNQALLKKGLAHGHPLDGVKHHGTLMVGAPVKRAW